MFSEIPKILLVEDNPGDIRLFQEMLSGEAPGTFNIEYVTNLADALEHLDKGGIDVVLLDLGLPDSQGLDTISRSYAHSPHMPFVVLTGLADETLGIAALRQGAQDYLRKGEVDGRLLLRSIRYATERKRAGEAIQQAYDELTQANRELQLEMEERRRAEKVVEAERRRLFSVLDSLPVFVYLKTPDYSIRFANRVFREIFGPPEGKHCYEAVVYREEPCPNCRSFEVLKTNTPQEWELPYDGRTFQIYDYPFTDVDGSPLILTLGMDITERKLAEKNLRFLASQLMTAQERERKRISRDLHDVLGGGLVSLKLQTKGIEKSLATETKEIKSDFGHIFSYLDGLMEKVRRLSRDLSPAILEDLGITTAIRHLFNQYAKHHKNCRSSLEIDEIDDLFNVEDKINIYRIFQEALTNIRKYAHASHITGTIKKSGNKVSFLIEDNGRGFDVHRALTADVTERGLGLASMEERVRMLGSELHLWSEEGKGTRISFTVPIANRSPTQVSGG